VLNLATCLQKDLETIGPESNLPEKILLFFRGAEKIELQWANQGKEDKISTTNE
jgi:hypothetical protein